MPSWNDLRRAEHTARVHGALGQGEYSRNDQGLDPETSVTWALEVERVTGIEPTLSAWEVSMRHAL
ncbi:MAG: hypothetical protein JWN52_1986 [Actinomycetia bacterium]|nr:hypothetical protein [Actinomycetes bacterium]